MLVAGKQAAPVCGPAASAATFGLAPLAHPASLVQCRADAAPQMRGGGRASAGRQLGGRGGRGRGGSASGGRGGSGGGSGRPCDVRQPPTADRQVSFTGAFPEDPVTAIIGGGLSGLACAQELARRGLRSVVFDTGEHGVGGRLATRTSADDSLKGVPPGMGLVFDHAAQYFTATDPAFQSMVDRWVADGAACRWTGPVGTLRDGAFTPDASQVRYVARGGMRNLAEYLAGQATRALRAHAQQDGRTNPMNGLVEVRRPQWVSSVLHTQDGWQLVGRGREQGCFDAVVVAHNGKCANRLAAPMGVPGVYGQLKRLKLSANWVLMVAFNGTVQVPGGVEGAFIQGSDVLSWAANNTAKLGLGSSSGSGLECWTLISTQAYGRTNKVPQENVPADVAQRVTAEMLAAFERSLGLQLGSLPPVAYTKAQLWGAALPINSPRVPCIWDPVGRVGVCGDWVAEGGSMQAAALSGHAMAERIDASRGRRPTDIADLAQGLTTPLKPVAGEEIGQFPQAGGASGKGGQAPVAAPAAEQQQLRQGAPRQQQRGEQRQQRPRQQQQDQAGGAAAAGGSRQAPRQEGSAAAAAKAVGAASGPALLQRPVRRSGR